MAAATATVYGYQIARDAAVVVARSVDAVARWRGMASRLAGVLATTGSWQQAAAGNWSGGSRRSGLGRVNGVVGER